MTHQFKRRTMNEAQTYPRRMPNTMRETGFRLSPVITHVMKCACALCAILLIAMPAHAAQLPRKEKRVIHTNWPNDVDGDVFRRMKKSGFDFDAVVDIDFNVDFSDWPPSPALLEKLRAQFPLVKVIPPDGHGSGYVQFVIRARVTYELVMSVQRTVSDLALPYGGVCESWGVLHD
jgi:hypothetical protein